MTPAQSEPARPNLNKLDPEVRAYIEHLEAQIEHLHDTSSPVDSPDRLRSQKLAPESAPPAEPPTTINLVTATTSGLAKRTPRHLYTLQRRGGMGIFDLEAPDEDPPALLTLADLDQTLLLVTDQARAFRLPVSAIPETPVRARGASILAKIDLYPGERLAAMLPEQAQGYLTLLSQSGLVRMLRHHVFGEYMRPGTSLYDAQKAGPLAGASWTPGDGDLFIATRSGRAIRFQERMISPQGTLGIRLSGDDVPIGITPVNADSRVFLLGADGLGTIRLMSGFAPNKAPGAGGKIALKNEHLVCALNVDDQMDIFIITKLSKLIRFKVAEIPPKEGVVQGVICLTLRADQPVAVALNPIPTVL